jgi:hypothetical protein
MEAMMNKNDSFALDEYEQGIEDICETFVPVDPVTNAKIDAAIEGYKAEHSASTITISLDASYARRLNAMAQTSKKTPAELVASMVRRELAYA